MEPRPQVGQQMFFLDKSEMSPTDVSQMKRLQLTSDDDMEVICVDDRGVSVRFWREGRGDTDAFMPGDEWKRWAYVPLLTLPNTSGTSRQHTHAERRFPDEIY